MSDIQTGWQRQTADIAESERLRQQARTAMAGADWGTGASLLRRAIDLDPVSMNFDLLGECLLHQGRPREAVVTLAAGTGLGHNQFKTRVKLAEALYGLGKAFHHDALWQLEEALRIDPGYGVARRLLRAWLDENPGLREHLHPSTPTED